MPTCLSMHASFHQWLRSTPGYKDQITFHSFFPPSRGHFEAGYRGRYRKLLGQLNIVPYSHQVEALEATAARRHVVIATPTASGKSLCYQLPTVDVMMRGGSALYLFPTKALARDQHEKLTDLAARVGSEAAVCSYDGDTPVGERRTARRYGACILTNPDMLHHGILPRHAQWASFLARLELIVIDELHSYRGVMGVHVANILRRLSRVVELYGGAPQFIAASATIGNPAEHAQNLTGLDFLEVGDDTGPRAAREFMFWQPPVLDDSGRRRSPNTEAAELAARFVRAGLKSIFFCNSRKTAELLRRYATGQLDETEHEQLASYRAGYTAEDRRKIEAGFKKGDIRVITATSALELGVDVGSVDAVVLVGYPGSMVALRQRAGRAGRRATRSLTLLVPGLDPLDEYYLHHPDAITEGKAERAVADAFNSELHPLHLACAARESPLAPEEPLVGQGFALEQLAGFELRGGRYHYLGPYPHRRVSIRGIGGRRVILRDGQGRALGLSDEETALRELHPGAVYLHQGETYLVRSLDLERGVATLLPHIEDYYTQPRSDTSIAVLAPEADLRGVRVGRVRVRVQVHGFVRKRYYSEAAIDERALDLPEVAFNTHALWFDVSDVKGVVAPAALPSAMHALEHTLIGLLPAFVLCERADVGGVSYPLYPDTGEPLVFIYDGYPGGVGYSRAGALVFRDWLAAARDLLAGCECRGGCPRCILSPKCGNGNQNLDKDAARLLAAALLERLPRAAALSLEA